jgi:type VI secretion system protein ImpM
LPARALRVDLATPSWDASRLGFPLSSDAAEASIAPHASVPGWFGKLATLGDFAHRRLPPHWLQACDTWLSQALVTSQARLGEAWLSTYLTSPPQRFAWAPGVIDERWWLGVFMPSCDSVGRYFPLVIASSVQQMPWDRAALDGLDRWYEHLVSVALQTLHEQGAAVPCLEEALQGAPAWAPMTASRTSTQAAVGLAGRHEHRNATPLGDWVASLAARTLHDALEGCSMWWPAGADGLPGSTRIVSGLPADEDFVDLLANR